MRAALAMHGLLAVWIATSATAQLPEDPPILVIVHPSNPARTLDRHQLQAIFSVSQRFWPHGAPTTPFNSAVHSAMRVRFDEVVLGLGPREVGQYWVDQKVRGGPPAPRQVAAASVMVSIVRRLEPAVGYVASGTCLKGVRVVAVVEGGKVRAPTNADRGEGECKSEP